MNDEMNELRRRLEAATARDETSENVSDAETSSLRQGWLALGRLLDAAEAPLSDPADRWTLPVARRPHVGRLTVVMLVAASLLVALAGAWLLRDTRPAPGLAPSPDQIASQEKPKPVEAPDRPAVPPPRRAALATAQLQWDDSLDEQLVSAAQAMMSVQQSWDSSAGGFDYVRYGLEQAEDDLQDGKL